MNSECRIANNELKKFRRLFDTGVVVQVRTDMSTYFLSMMVAAVGLASGPSPVLPAARGFAPGSAEALVAVEAHRPTRQVAPEAPVAAAPPTPGASLPEDAEPSAHPAHPSVAAALSRVIGGPHDFSQRSGRSVDACSACHVPHVQAVRPAAGPRAAGQGATSPSQTAPAGADAPPGIDPDPAHASGDSTGDDSFQAAREAVLELYRMEGQRSTFETDRFTPGPTSLVCLGCHDGTVATSTIGTAHAMLSFERDGFESADQFMGRDHPIGIPYPADPRQYRPLVAVEKSGIRLPDGRLECVSCHDPHGATDHLLIMSNRRSALCLTCHVK